MLLQWLLQLSLMKGCLKTGGYSIKPMTAYAHLEKGLLFVFLMLLPVFL